MALNQNRVASTPQYPCIPQPYYSPFQQTYQREEISLIPVLPKFLPPFPVSKHKDFVLLKSFSLNVRCPHFNFFELEHLAEPAVSPCVTNSSAEKEHIQLAFIFHA